MDFLWLSTFFVPVLAQTWHCPTGYCVERKFLGDSAKSFRCTAYPTQSTFCAFADEACECHGTVRFGALGTTSWAETSMSSNGRIDCNRSAFGEDPAPGQMKACVCEANDYVAIQDEKPVYVDGTACYEAQHYDLTKEVDCIHLPMQVKIPSVAISMGLSVSHVYLLGQPAVKWLLEDSSASLINVSLLSDRALLVGVAQVPSLASAISLTNDLDFDDAKTHSAAYMSEYYPEYAIYTRLFNFDMDEFSAAGKSPCEEEQESTSDVAISTTTLAASVLACLQLFMSSLLF